MPKKRANTRPAVEPEEQPQVDEEGEQQREHNPCASLVLPTEQGQGKLFVFVGSMGSGKTYAVRHILYRYLKSGFLKFGIAFVPTKLSQDFDFLPDSWVQSKFSMDKLEQYMNFLVRKREQIKAKRGPNADLPMSFVVCDDSQGVISQYSPIFQQFIVQHRHLRVVFFLVAQSLAGSGTSTALRNWANHVFLYRARTGNELSSMYSAFGQFSRDRDKSFFANDQISIVCFMTRQAKSTAVC